MAGLYAYAQSPSQIGSDVTTQTSKTIYKNKFSLEFYSETVYDSRFDGSTNQTRARYYLNEYKIKPYISLNFSRDLSHGNAPILMLNAWSPGLGILYKPIRNLGILIESRRLVTEQIDTLNENIFGAYYYDFLNLNKYFFNEIYSEAFAVDRVEFRPYFMMSNKLGIRTRIFQNLNYDIYAEGFVKNSPNLGYGPSEHEARLGTRFSYYHQGLSFFLNVNYAPISDVKTNGIDFLFALSGEF